MKRIVVLVIALVMMLTGCVAHDLESDANTSTTTETTPTEIVTNTPTQDPKWQDDFSNKLSSEIEAAFTEIGENPDNIIKVTFIKTRSTGYIFEQKDYKVEFSWTLGKPGYKHSRYYRITTQNYFEGEPEKAEYPDEFLTTIKYWVGDDGYGTNVNQWSWTGNGEKK